MPAPVITASTLVYRIGAPLVPSYKATGATGNIYWVTNLGAIANPNDNGVSFSPNPTANNQYTFMNFTDLLAAYNRTRIGWVWANDTADNAQSVASLSIYATFPLQPHFGYDVDIDNKTLVSVAEDGTAVFRKKGGTKRSWTLQMPNRPATEYIALRDFWAFHEKTTEFYFYDLPLNELVLVRFDSGLKVQPQNMNLINMSCVLREI
jgi:hypothetical protein